MDTEYDSKFEEMKKYIPFLESMIKRLESTCSASENPRQAQLDKIRSLRDLLMDKKKRMKMENLLKCEQVLVNLYAKVEQRDTAPVVKMPSEDDFLKSQSNIPDLNSARNKLKCAAAKLKEEPDTLPEIARASQTEIVCIPGSKEPALFQRRPNKASVTPPKHPTNVHQGKSSPQKNKRNYTRVLVSPEPSVRRWSTAEGTTSDMPLFSRRSPKRSHQKYSPPYYKRERKKLSDLESHPKKQKDLNITLNVPEESLGSLNTKDILSRIINCSDGDVDIDTLRELRSQILGELKQTGASDDISDLILKSYKNRRKNKRRDAEIEEGELSDSESEAIDSIYGSLVIVDQNKESKSTQVTKPLEKCTQPRKIQICLVINSDTAKKNSDSDKYAETETDASDTKMHQENQEAELLKSSDTEALSQDGMQKNTENQYEASEFLLKKSNINQDVITIDDEDDYAKVGKNKVQSNKGNFQVANVNLRSRNFENSTNNDNPTLESMLENVSSPETDFKSIPDTNASVDENESLDDKIISSEKNNSILIDKVDKSEKEPEMQKELSTISDSNGFNNSCLEGMIHELSNDNCKEAMDSMKQLQLNQKSSTIKANFYKPFMHSEDIKNISNKNKNTKPKSSESIEFIENIQTNVEEIEIPFLNSETTSDVNSSKAGAVSEIDILQALKNEILNENLSIPVAKIDTPLLHQPKITKVANAQQVLPKKRISIEKYKEKAVASASIPLFLKDPKVTHSGEESHKKQSLKLTEKECERFNFPSKLALDESSDDEDKDVSSMSLDDIYGDLAPKSPDHDKLFDSEVGTPVIIPSEPVRHREDIDLRNITSPFENKEVFFNNSRHNIKSDQNFNKNQVRTPLIDPRLRRDISQTLSASPNPFERAPMSTSVHHPNMTPSMTPNTRGFEMTPTYNPLEPDNFSGKKHVYTPILPVGGGDIRDVEKAKEREERKSRWDLSDTRDSRSRWENPDPWRNPVHRDEYIYNKPECPRTPSHPFGRNECPATPNHNFGRSDCPLTPSHPFGRLDCPSTPNHPFGRSECPQTPSHPFGRSESQPNTVYPFGRSESSQITTHGLGRLDCPSTPTHQFGLLETPLTPIHPFGRSECPVTPNHPFGRSEMPMTPSHPFGRTDFHQSQSNARFGRGYPKDPRLNRNSEIDNLHNQFYNNERSHSYTRDRNISRFTNTSSNSDSFRNHGRDMGGIDRSFSNERNRNNFQRDIHRREPSIGRTVVKDYESDRQHAKERGVGKNQESLRGYKEVNSAQREYSVGRSVLPSDTKTIPSDVTKNNLIAKDNTLSVKSDAGRSFTIDTSVSSTFQEILSRNKIDNTTDKRMKRSGSVGRTLVRESSMRPSSPHHSDFDNKEKRDKFRRACSVGRDVHLKTEKSFQDVKADFESYRKTAKEHDKLKFKHSKSDTQKISGPRTRNDVHDIKNDKRSNKHAMYSPTKNYRDPRLRREQQDSKHRSDNKFSRDRSSYGIVYSNDNIAKGTILGSGYGVKNYKIPKIKRIPQEKDKEMSDQSETTDNMKDENTLSGEISHSEKRVSSLRKTFDKSEVKVKHYTKKAKSLRTKKAVIYDSDSEDGVTENNDKDKCYVSSNNLQSIKNTSKKTSPAPVKQTDSKNKADAVCSRNDDMPPDDFSLDDLEFFPNNIESDQVLDNIDALIADLDNEIDPCKPPIAKTPSEAITERGKNDSERSGIKYTLEDDTLNVISDFINDNSTAKRSSVSEVVSFTKNLQRKIQKDCDKNNVQISEKEIDDKDTERNSTPRTDSQQEPVMKELSNKREISDTLKSDDACQTLSTVNNVNNEAIVSTTEINEVQYNKISDLKISDTSSIVCSTPDSTNDTENVIKEIPDQVEGMPDSTDESHCETNAEITTTKDCSSSDSKEVAESNSAPKKVITQADPLDSLLSILQDKTKIKELLSKLGDHSSDNEKIKKKLEKLSEIVSDEEETNEAEAKNKDTSVESTTEHQAKNNFKSDDTQAKKNNLPFENTVDHCAKSDFKCDIPLVICNDKSLDEENSTNVVKKDVKTDSNSEALANIVDNEDDTNKKCMTIKKKKAIQSKTKSVNKVKGRGRKKMKTVSVKRITRSEASNLYSEKPTKKKRLGELGRLQDDIREMFISNDILNATGIRMCRLAKLVNEKNEKGPSPVKEILQMKESEPVVVLEKFKNLSTDEAALDKVKKKPGPKPGAKKNLDHSTSSLKSKLELQRGLPKYTPGPKSKKKISKKSEDADPYAFETDSMAESNSIRDSEKSLQNSSDSENDSIDSSKSPESSELLIEYKKAKKRKRPGWQAGIIKSKNKKKKVELKQTEMSLDCVTPSTSPQRIVIPDLNCFTDKTYCFVKNIFSYSCRLCTFTGQDIVHHYKKQHPHSEIPLSRMSPEIAKEAIEQCEEINFTAISKIPTEKYVCRFCFKEFAKKKAILEAFFWHVVSTHTGEFKQLCSECINVTRCPFNLDIPPPPKDVKGQLIGYICGKCNFTQISLENLKTHVIVRHNDEQTEVYTINLAAMSKRTINSLSKRCEISNKPRVLRSSRSNHSMTEASDEYSDNTETSGRVVPELERRMSVREDDKLTESTRKVRNMQSKITFETDDTVSETSTTQNEESVTNLLKLESDDNNDENSEINIVNENIDAPITKVVETQEEIEKPIQNNVSDDILIYPHFRISYTKTGTREYVCCINGNDNHYRTTFQISIKKHVQISHKEKWDGYCFVCKLIVTSQGTHSFKDCLLHYFDKHMDNFPMFEKVDNDTSDNKATPRVSEIHTEDETSAPKPKSYIQVRPMSELLSDNTQHVDKNSVALPDESSISQPPDERSDTLPKIQAIVSLGSPSVEPPQQSLNYPNMKNSEPPKEYKYEEIQAKVMSKKHRVVLETMMSKNKLVNLFKCAGRYCSFTSDSAEDALLHASTHKRIGGENALECCYCDFDSLGNAIDLIMHVFKAHGSCSFVCGQCFYRASASQLVCAHTTRVHQGSSEMQVLRSTIVIKPSANEDLKANMLNREVAVQYFVCKNADAESATESCKFRTYLPNKFYEHLVNKHSSSTEHPCCICDSVSSTPAELIQHLKTHGMKSYQCTWCVHGGDNEAELLAHASAKHPDKPPQAYLRMVTSKDGSTERRVLPLVQFNKSKVSSEDVNPGVNTENPVREAERSLELEKLIIDTMVMVESRPTTPMESPQKDTEVACPLADDTPIEAPDDQVISNISDIPVTAPIQVTPPRSVTPAQPDITSQLTPVLKKELTDVTPKLTTTDTDVIYSLDSDEEDTKQGIIDLSLDDAKSPPNVPVTSPTPQKTTENKTPEPLFSCANCRLFFTNMPDYEKHVMECFVIIKDNTYICPICKFQSDDKNKVLLDVSECSAKRFLRSNSCAKRYECDICNCLAIYMSDIKAHLKKNHGVNKAEVLSNYDKNGQIIYKLRPSQAVKKPGPKRKPSTGTPVKTREIKKYGPQDINKLPINPILDELVYCSVCEFNTKVRLNMVRHLQMHAEQQPVPQTVPVNPVPHLETNEKHFDKMVNLASSSIVTRAPDKSTKPESAAGVTLLIPPEAAARYPKYVPERQRLTCGARGCSYISVDEGMLKYHWETLHEGTNDYQCVHCPPYQQLDTSRPLTATRIIAHLKMHDVRLFACSVCSYYHHRRPLLEKHLNEVHKNGQILVVREESNASSASAQSQQATSAPTMDLKPWQCGLCKFKSMLRQEVVEHCAKIHQSKMQFKCSYCPFRTSTLENVTKHQMTAHSDKNQEVFYFYYREGTIPDEPDGTPRWAKQRQKMPNSPPEVKTEVVDNIASTEMVSTAAASTAAISTATVSTASVSTESVPTVSNVSKITVDLNMVKKEIEDREIVDSIEDLCKQYGQFCEPNGLKFKCPLCKIVTEDSKEAIQSHLYEELSYRKWACGICSYKAFHKKGLGEHMQAEHRSNAAPLELPLDLKIEKWVNKLLDHQQNIIHGNRLKLTNQSLLVEKPKEITAASKAIVTPSENARPQESSTVESQKSSMQELEAAFGQFGESNNLQFTCPKCSFKVKEESAMQDHLETELTKIRWCCSNCADKFQTYHEAQFHCKSVHAGLSARPVEAIRDPSVRSAWIEAVIRVQKLSMNFMPVSEISAENTDAAIPGSSGTTKAASPEPFENSLLVVRYAERVPTPEEQTLARRKRSAPVDGDSDDDNRLVIDDVNDKMKKNKCLYCNFKTRYNHVLQTHLLRHYNLKKFSCAYCDLTFSTKNAVFIHQDAQHHDKGRNAKITETPKVSPLEWSKNKVDVIDIKDDEDLTKLLCLICLKEFTRSDALSHMHDNTKTNFVLFGNGVFECGVCCNLFTSQALATIHHISCHPNTLMNVKPLKIYFCAYCNRNCKLLRDLRSHHKLIHPSMDFKYYVSHKKLPLVTEIIDVDSDSGTKRTSDDTSIFPAPKRIAKKSTTKLPKVLTVAKKSTTKLPLYAISDESDDEENMEYSYYGTNPLPLENYSNITTLMPFYSTVMPFTIRNLKAVMKIDPVVVVKDFRKC